MGLLGSIPIVGDVVNGLVQANQNKKDRAFSREMYEKQKADSLDFWNMQNTYNSPQEQMKRLQEAGLNPNLVYGEGATGNVASAPQAPQPKEFTQQAPKFGDALKTGVDAYFSTQAKQAQVDNMKLQNDLLAQRKLMNEIDYDLPTYESSKNSDDSIGNISFGNRYDKLRADSQNSQYQASISKVRAHLEKTNAPVTVQSVLQAYKNLQATGDRIQSDIDRSKAATQVLRNQAQIQEWEKMLNEGGVSRNAPFFIHWIITQLDKMGKINK